MNQPKRSKDNRNHILHYDPEYTPCEGVIIPVMTEKGPLVRNYLDQAYGVFNHALQAHSRVLALRFDLHLPKKVSLPDDAESNQVIRRFLSSLQSRIDAHLKRKGNPHSCPVRHIVAREVGRKSGRVHFHVMLLLNGHAFRHVGAIETDEDNLFWRIVAAWTSALGIDLREAVDGVQFGFKRGVVQYYLYREKDYDKLRMAFHRASYLCKAATKRFGQRHQGLMTSKT